MIPALLALLALPVRGATNLKNGLCLDYSNTETGGPRADSVSGKALFPVNARNGPDLLRAADAALYKAKKYDRGTFQVARGITGPLATHNIIEE